MGRTKLTPPQVEVIKYLLKTKTMTHGNIGKLFGITRCQVTHINMGIRWDNINTPNDLRGEYLYLRHLNGKLNNE
jgi:hypothetical protein